MMMPGRKYEPANGYRYGFNGKENDKDAGEGIQDYGMRIYSERLGRFLSVDPITKNYPELTPYQFASNRPIEGKDFDGLEFCRYDLDCNDPNVKWMAEQDHVTNYRDSKLYQIFNKARDRWSGSGGIVEGMAWALGEQVVVKGANWLYRSYKYTKPIIAVEKAVVVAEKVTTKVISKVIGATGQVGEQFLKTLGGVSQKYFPTTVGKGGRYVDQFVNGVAHESKVGYTTLTKDIEMQIAKDAELLANSEKTGVKEVMWNFFKSCLLYTSPSPRD